MIRLLGICLAVLFLAAPPARAAETLRVGNDAPASLYFCTLDYGMEQGIFARHGLAIEASSFAGTAKGQPALIGGSIDILLGAGSEMAYVVKGAPELAVAVVAGAPGAMALIVQANSPIHALAELKGGRLGITNTGGLTDWLARQVINREHFGPNDITVVAAGTTPTEVALLRTGALEGAVLDTVQAHALAANGTARILQVFGTYVPDFASTVIYAHRDLMQNHPELLRAFLSAWFEAKDALRADMDGAIACTVHKTGAPPEIAREVIAEVAPDFSPDGRFRPAAMAVLAQSFVETGVLPTAPDPTTLYTEAFLPPR